MPDTSASPPTILSSIQAPQSIPLLDISAGVAWKQGRTTHLNSTQAAPRDVMALSMGLSQALHEFGVGLLVLLLGRPQHQFVVLLGFIREVGIHFHGIDSEVAPFHHDHVRNNAIIGNHL